MRRIRRLLLTLALAALAALPASATAALVVPDGGARISGGTYQREMDVAKAAGLPWVSVGASWASLQPAPGAPLGPDGPGGAAWRTLEGQVTYAHAIGLRIFVQFTGAPSWANGGSPDKSAPPTAEGRAAYASFLGQLAARLGPYIDAYSAWNEVNQPEYWNPIDPQGFAALQRAVYPAIKAADPTGLVVSGTIYSKGGTFDFMRAAYAAGLRGSFDVLGWMLFSSVQPEDPPPPGRGSPQPTLPSVLDLQAFLAANDPGRPIWIVEYGYSTCQVGDNGFVCVSEATQADYLARAYTYMRRYLSVDRMFWFSLKDLGPGGGREANYGLVRNDFGVKPSFGAMQSLRVNVADGGAGPDPLAAVAPPAPALPKAAARPPDPPALTTRAGKRVALGRPVIRLRKGLFTLALKVTVKGGRTKLAVQGYRGKRWRHIATTRIARTSRIVVRFRDRGYLGIRIRATVPGTNRWGVSRVIRAPRQAARARVAGGATSLSRSAARPPDPPAFRVRGRRIALGRPVVRLTKGRYTLMTPVALAGGRSTLLVQGYRGGKWRRVGATRLARSSRPAVRFKDRGYLGLRVRGTVPGSGRWAVSRVIRSPRAAAAR